MAAWAHLEITVDDQGNVEVGGYNADPEALVEGTESWEGFLAGAGSVAAGVVEARVATAEPTDLADILFTSGTTGAPKGVMAAHDR